MCDCECSRDELLRLCVTRHERRFARRVICAILHNAGVKSLNVKTTEVDGAFPIRLRRHLVDLVKALLTYKLSARLLTVRMGRDPYLLRAVDGLRVR